MHVTIEINGRQALPVRAIPLLTDWRGLSPDQLAQILAGDSDHWPSFDGLTAYRLRPDGSTEPIPPRWWASWVVRKLQATSDAIKAKQASHETGNQQWRGESLAQLPAGVFVWRDEFEAAHANEYGPEGMRARSTPDRFDPGTHALDFNPQPDPAIAPWRLVLEGFMPNGDAGDVRLNRALERLNAPREELPQEYHGAFALWCEVDAIDRQARELETTRPVGVTEILASRAALKELHAERARLLAVLDGKEPPAQDSSPAPTTEPVAENSASSAPETKEHRQDRRLQACIDAGMPMDTRDALSRLPDGVGRVAGVEGVSRQTFSIDVKAALKRRESARREGVIVHRE